MKNQNQQYRQGDVFIARIASLPAKLKKAALEGGKVILAHGEVTGHAHAFAASDATKFTDESGAEFFDVKGRRFDFTLPIVRRWKNQVMVHHPELGVIEFAEVDVQVDGNEVTVTGNFGLLKHDEHTAHGIPAGTYRGAGMKGTVRQREYSPEAIRRVAD
jgi:hypothetical protein